MLLSRWKYAGLAVVFAAVGAYSRLPATAPRQPIAFTHARHVQAGLQCLDCHRYAARSPQAGLPSVRECSLCHQKINPGAPALRQVAVYARAGEEIPWRPVYGFAASARVRFRHDMHVAVGVACSSCHGDVAHEATARRSLRLDMGVCLGCHRQHGASTECEKCHD